MPSSAGEGGAGGEQRRPAASRCACPRRRRHAARLPSNQRTLSHSEIYKMATAEPVSTLSTELNSRTAASVSPHAESGGCYSRSRCFRAGVKLCVPCHDPGAALETNPSPPLADEDGAEESGQEIVSPEAYIKHPLQNRWSLWFFKNDKSKTWQANLRLISKFDTVEDFWALYNHIQLSSNLMSGCDYSLFKDGIEPMWEDERNKRGGRWLMTLTKQMRRLDLDRFWLETVVAK
nr:PREDICTED: eukaryotic translation initiation factor 4E-like [Paralichthys olivaceus]